MIFGHFDLTYFCRAADYRGSRPQASDVVDGVYVEVDEGDDEARHVPHSGLHDVHWEVPFWSFFVLMQETCKFST